MMSVSLFYDVGTRGPHKSRGPEIRIPPRGHTITEEGKIMNRNELAGKYIDKIMDAITRQELGIISRKELMSEALDIISDCVDETIKEIQQDNN